MNTSEGQAAVIEVENLTRKFRRKTALDNISLSVPEGCVYGLVGGNGAGKTTLVKHLLGTFKAQQGRVQVLGQDPVAQPVEVLSRMGYLSEDRDLPGWMRVRDWMRYSEAFYPAWDRAYAERLRERFGLDPYARIKRLSRGEIAKAGLLAALAFRPPLLLLDEPSSGLDPSARRNILEAIIRTVADEGRTVFFSSHLLDEVERVADRVAMLHQGQLVFEGTMDKLHESHRRWTLHFETAPQGRPQVAGALHLEGAGQDWTAISEGDTAVFRAMAQSAGARIVEEAPANLEEIFLARAGHAMVMED